MLQAKNNLRFIGLVTDTENFEWQVTISFYVAVHLINAHLASTTNSHYRTHNQVESAINPYQSCSVSKLPEDQYLAYIKLQNLSRRARYLIHDDLNNSETRGFFTYSKHLAKTVKNLEIILSYFNNTYNETFEPTNIQCIDLRNRFTSNYFNLNISLSCTSKLFYML